MMANSPYTLYLYCRDNTAGAMRSLLPVTVNFGEDDTSLAEFIEYLL